MNTFSKLLAASLLSVALLGCSSDSEPKKVKEVPARTVEGVFKGSSIAQAKNMLMGACSSGGLSIKTEALVVTCETKKMSSNRERDLTLVVNDEFASDIREIFQFTLTGQGSDVLVKANSLARYQAPVSVLEPNQIRTRNLLDDTAERALKKLLNQAGASI